MGLHNVARGVLSLLCSVLAAGCAELKDAPPAVQPAAGLREQAVWTPPSGLVSWWSAEGNAQDVQGANHGTLLNGATFAPRGTRQAFRFDGIDDHVRIGNPTSLQLTGNLSLAAWVNPAVVPAPGLDGTFAIATKWGQSNTGDGYGIWLYNASGQTALAGGIGVPGSDDYGIGGGTIPLNTWTHVAMTYNSATGVNKLYVNGVLVAERVRAGGVTNSSRNLLIGKEDSFRNRHFNGQIDEVLIYNRELSASELLGLYNAG